MQVSRREQLEERCATVHWRWGSHFGDHSELFECAAASEKHQCSHADATRGVGISSFVRALEPSLSLALPRNCTEGEGFESSAGSAATNAAPRFAAAAAARAHALDSTWPALEKAEKEALQ
eukprot:133777-Pleurochrysis_carterae.AAC.1